MLPSLLGVLLWSVAAVGLGAPLVTGLAPELRAGIGGFLGLALMSLAGMAVNSFAPVTAPVSVSLAAVGVLACVFRRRMLTPRGHLSVLFTAGVTALICAAMPQLPSRQYDTGLYHLQAVQWIRAARQPLGLANLHGRLGFNSSWFAAGAVLEIPGLEGRSAFVAPALPLVFAAALSAAGFSRLAHGDRSFGSGLLASLAIPACLALEALASLSPDDPAMLVGLTAMALLALALEDGPAATGAPVGFLLASFAATLKLSAAMVLPPALVTLALVRSPRLLRYTAVAFAAALVAVWVFRGVAGSGCIAYPIAATCLGVPWAVPSASAAGMHDLIVTWARAPAVQPAGVLAPLGRAYPYFAAGDRAPLLAAVALVAVLPWVTSRPRAAELGRAQILVLAMAVAGLAYWAFTAPDPRFGVIYFIACGAVPCATGMVSGDPRKALRARFALAVSCTVMGLWGARGVLLHHSHAQAAMFSFPEFPQPTLERRLVGGKVVHVPAQGDQCWAGPIPCTPNIEPGLVVAEPFSFRVEPGDG